MGDDRQSYPQIQEPVIMSKPGIVTAIPRRRYRLGEFSLVVLGEIESNDDRDYRYIMAVVQGDDPQPGIYLTAERNREAGHGGYDMRLVMRDGEDVIGSSADWDELDAFTDEAIRIVSQILNLGDEEPYRMM
jgi:hypothetical protein